MEKHISTTFDKHLDKLGGNTLKMGSLLSERLTNISQNIGKPVDAKSSAAFEKEINALEVKLDEECVRLLALHRPAASDLRFVISSSRIINDLESIGDEIARLTDAIANMLDNLNEKDDPSLNDIADITSKLAGLLKEVLIAYDNEDCVQAARIILKEREMEELFRNAIRTRITMIMEEARNVKSSVHGFWMLRSLERIGKCTRQIGNHILYHVEGHDARHKSREHLRERFLENN
ncbi:MAG: phosphate signaling complex protein PhoU [Candidatus Portiera sp.]|nr:phosphate signaling complex protein PhoU [Portiera sp.]